MDFIRELIQNSIDAGTPRIEVWVNWSAPEPEARQGVLEIHVDDFGEGMDEDIIDAQLTRMFASTKEDDLTKIGKFGIGFTSIFSMQPSAVLLHTGKHGENWEVLFHPDRSFEKIRLDRPVRGTQITLFKHLSPPQLQPTITELREVLSYWCEHSDVPISFTDRCGASPTASTTSDAADPWAGFADDGPAPAPMLTITRPMILDTPVQLRVSAHTIEAVVGYQPTPTYSFFNGGITLVRATDLSVLGLAEHTLAHLSFKVKCRALEHTLTRDNVLHDAAWSQAISVIEGAAKELAPMLITHVANVAASKGEDLEQWQRQLAIELSQGRSIENRPIRDQLEEAAILRDRNGVAVPTADILDQARTWGAFLLSHDDDQLAAGMEARGLHLLESSDEAQRLLHAIARIPFRLTDKLLKPLPVIPADQFLTIPDLLPADSITAEEMAILETVTNFYSGAIPFFRLRIRLVGLHTATDGLSIQSDTFCFLGDPESGICHLRQRRDITERLLLKRPSVLLNRSHPQWRTLRALAADHPRAASMALTQMVSEACGLGWATYHLNQDPLNLVMLL
jgi:hypothetical protein